MCDKLGLPRRSYTVEQLKELLQIHPMPVLLDDAFAYYDQTRLEQTLRWLSTCPNQVLLFTCHTREQEILDRWGSPYHKVLLTDS